MNRIGRRRSSHRLLLLLLLPMWVAGFSQVGQGQEAAPQPGSSQTVSSSDAAKRADQPRFFDSVTVSATMNPVKVKDTPGTVSVIDAETIERRMVENVADLITFEPGVYIESNLTRVGLNGFNIRGIGGNRVMTQVDGVETSEQFDFGPFNVHQFALDLDTLKTAEIVRSSGSSLYGSDALGGVVSFFTKDPSDYLGGRQQFHLGAKTLYDSRSQESSGNIVLAGGGLRVQGSLFVSYGSGHEVGNQGEIDTQTATRTTPNPQNRRFVQALGKTVFTLGDGNTLRGVVEIADHDVETQAYASRGITVTGPIATNVADITSDDTMRRRRLSVDQSLADRGGVNLWSWNTYVQTSDTDQVVDELRITSGAGPVQTVDRSGTLEYEQDSYGGALQGRKAVTPGGHALLLTFGGSYKHNTFDMIRDRVDVNAATGAIIPATNLILPSKYFPKSDVGEVGSYVQAEMRFGRLTLVPGVRYDRLTLDADQSDPVFVASLSPAAVDFSADATSARVGAAFTISNALTLHAQYAGGFRAPPYSAVNSGFTNLAGGYTSIPNTELDAETSDNIEFGLRSATGPVSLAVTGFVNRYDNFILQMQRGVNASTRLLEFQYQNVSRVNISGVELQGEARLTDGLRLRASYAIVRGNDVSGAEGAPLDSIAPDQGAFGLIYSARSNRWGSDVTIRTARGQSQETAGAGMFAPDAYGIADLVGWMALGRTVTLRGGVLNLTDQKYFEWPNIRGRAATDPAIDRYSSPGVSGIVSVSYGW